jgi:hypothetical protein
LAIGEGIKANNLMESLCLKNDDFDPDSLSAALELLVGHDSLQDFHIENFIVNEKAIKTLIKMVSESLIEKLTIK